MPETRRRGRIKRRHLMKRVYIAGPYTRGNVSANVKRALEAATRLIELGFCPFVPHLFHFLHAEHEQPYETWMALDFEWLAQCDVVLRLPGYSPGADQEVQRAGELGIPVFF